ncbi:hypothetical protein AcV7_003562 [Taiwanofungus camphoratus]|nr:hypothetical protein AcV7_003562 [Antrodia cinnamomea]
MASVMGYFNDDSRTRDLVSGTKKRTVHRTCDSRLQTSDETEIVRPPTNGSSAALLAFSAGSHGHSRLTAFDPLPPHAKAPPPSVRGNGIPPLTQFIRHDPLRPAANPNSNAFCHTPGANPACDPHSFYGAAFLRDPAPAHKQASTSNLLFSAISHVPTSDSMRHPAHRVTAHAAPHYRHNRIPCLWDSGSCGIWLDDQTPGGVQSQILEYHCDAHGWDAKRRGMCVWHEESNACGCEMMCGSYGKRIAARVLRRCVLCKKKFARLDTLARHLKTGCPYNSNGH